METSEVYLLYLENRKGYNVTGFGDIIVSTDDIRLAHQYDSKELYLKAIAKNHQLNTNELYICKYYKSIYHHQLNFLSKENYFTGLRKQKIEKIIKKINDEKI